MKTIQITHSEAGGLDVCRGQLSSGGGLTLGEVLEQVISLLSKDGRPIYPMRPFDEWQSRKGSYSEVISQHMRSPASAEEIAGSPGERGDHADLGSPGVVGDDFFSMSVEDCRFSIGLSGADTLSAAREIVAGEWVGRHMGTPDLLETIRSGRVDGSVSIRSVCRALMYGNARRPAGPPPLSEWTIKHDGFHGVVIGYYLTLEGKPGVVLQLKNARVVHVYGEKWLEPVEVEEDRYE